MPLSSLGSLTACAACFESSALTAIFGGCCLRSRFSNLHSFRAGEPPAELSLLSAIAAVGYYSSLAYLPFLEGELLGTGGFHTVLVFRAPGFPFGYCLTVASRCQLSSLSLLGLWASICGGNWGSFILAPV